MKQEAYTKRFIKALWKVEYNQFDYFDKGFFIQ